MKLFAGLAGAVLGAAAGWFLPRLLIPHPHEFDYLAILGWRVILTPAGALAGLLLGVIVVRTLPRP
jgi:hypothetical protein